MRDYARKRGTTRIQASVREAAIGSGKKNIIYGAGVLAVFLAIFVVYFWREMRWRYIVIHHTASDIGDLDYYRKLHMEERGWPDIAYHFLINNGSSNTVAGQVEQSNLWKDRSINYSTKIRYLNYFGIAIVMVGNFEAHPVSSVQWESLVNLVASLSDRYGIPPDRIVGHREVWETACPGKYLSLERLRDDVRRSLSAGRAE